MPGQPSDRCGKQCENCRYNAISMVGLFIMVQLIETIMEIRNYNFTDKIWSK